MTAVLCFLLILAILLGAVGLGWVAGYLDYILFPVLFIFIGLRAYAWWHKRKAGGTAC